MDWEVPQKSPFDGGSRFGRGTGLSAGLVKAKGFASSRHRETN